MILKQTFQSTNLELYKEKQRTRLKAFNFTREMIVLTLVVFCLMHSSFLVRECGVYDQVQAYF